MRFADVVGHGRAVARLERAAAEGRVPGAVLLLGPAGIGKRALADAFAARLVCAAPDGDACGVCAQCTRVAAGTHPDVRVIGRDEDRRDLRIEQVRELSRWLGLQPLMAVRKVGIIDDAHCLNEHGQNALLKTLEEPPGASVVVVVSSSAALLLPTVRSRCQVVRLDPLAPDDVERVLVARGVETDRARALAPLADGSPGRALALDGEDEAHARKELLEALPALATLPAAKLSGVAQEVSRAGTDAALAAAVAWYRDALEVAVAGEALPARHPAAAEAIRAVAARTPPAVLLRQLEVVCDTIADLEKNANRMLSVETMLLWLRRLARDTGPSWTTTP
jgi:DNA polymerase-3 subunit delta'